MNSWVLLACLALWTGCGLAQRQGRPQPGRQPARQQESFHGRPYQQGGRSHHGGGGHSGGRSHSVEQPPRPQPPRPTFPATPTAAPVTVNPNAKCGLPNTMTGKLVVDWAKKDGKQYEYDVLDVPGLPTDPQEVNTMNTESLLGYVCLPGSSVPVANLIREYSFWELAQDGTKECVGHFVQSFAGRDGQQNMTVFDSSDATTSRQLVYYQIFDEPSTLSIRYSCKKPNLQTGVCDTPKVIVDIRKQPDQLSAAEKASLDAKINAILAPYCVSTSTPDFEKSTFKPELGPCIPGPSATFNALLVKLAALPDGSTCSAVKQAHAARQKENGGRHQDPRA